MTGRRMDTSPRLPVRTWLAVFSRLFAMQGAFNYETMIGNGIAFAMEPALRRLPGGPRGPAYAAALGRHSGYFNAHPYLAAVAVGALMRAELDGVPAAQIDRFRVAAAGPLGSVGDRLVWAGWLPLCSAIALLAFGLGATSLMVLLLFLGAYNVLHVGLRVWGLSVGWTHGLRVARALDAWILRRGPAHMGRATAFVAGVALPVAAHGIIGPGRALLGTVLASVAVSAAIVTALRGKAEGWQLAIVVLLGFTIYGVAR